MSEAGNHIVEQYKAIVENEGVLLDERRWSEWLELFTDDCVYWVPSWRGNGELSANPLTELSHIYYEGRQPLRDRVERITSGKSPASNPLPRTVHFYGGFQLIDSGAARPAIRCSWSTHVFMPFSRAVHTMFGRQNITFQKTESVWKIVRKEVVLQNDMIPTMMDINFL
jgi:3-phenylpropionate/cinnamic acid dioxygenase small subunit